MPFEARHAGTCARCGGPFERGDEITAAGAPNLVPQPLRHAGKVCPPRLVVPLADYRRAVPEPQPDPDEAAS